MLNIKKVLPIIIITILTAIHPTNAQNNNNNTTTQLQNKLIGTTANSTITQNLTLVNVEFFNNDNILQKGEIVIHKKLADDIVVIFEFIKENKIPVEMVVPIKFDRPNGNTSMANLNNTYSFHHRKKANAKSLSMHSYGTAIDINPFNNPYISPKGDTIPSGATYTPKTDPKSLHKSHPLVLKFKKLGWTWGGDWITIKDYMHFQKHIQ